jgi:hypothetical protein
MGALHPILFFVIVYGISLCMALMVCTSIYNYIHNDDHVIAEKNSPAVENSSTAIAMNTH